MNRTFSMLFVFLFLASCGKGGGGSDSASTGDVVDASEVSASAPVPQAALNFAVNVNLDNFNANQEDKVLQAADLIKKVIATDAFKNKILNFTYRGKKAFVDNDGLSNAQVYKKILEGAEMLKPSVDNEMDLDLEVYRETDNTVGYTYPNALKVWMNSKYLNQNSAAEVTTNMMHEWLHKLGFKHDVEATAKRPYSVPYAIGYIVRALAKKMI